MSWTPSEKEIQEVRKLDAEDRYEYLIKRITDQALVWSLWDKSGWALAGDPNGREAVPIWPHEEFAKACASGTWAGFVPKAIPFDEWITRWIPGMSRDKRLVVAFPTPGDEGRLLDPQEMQSDLQAELEKYE